ncbi:hypothetical protein C8R46DRAFT_1304502 [Mycena filopes]|nr:hypothetical protein C8R46DRAFT_1304502 [Mycena filopes]
MYSAAQYTAVPRSYSFPQVPFNGAPPKPSNIRVNPQDWQNGTWVMNPAFNSSQWSLGSSQSSQAWVPSQAWHQQRQQEWQVQQQQMAAAAASSYNPYKRVPRPPSAEYLATKLSDNPLGLSNMVPREELFGPTTDEGIAAATPWIWNPRGLDPDANEQGTSTNSRRAEPPPPASAPPYGNRAGNAPPPPMYSRQPQPREMTDPTPQQQRRNSMPTRHSSEPPADRRTPVDSLPTLDRPLERPRQYQGHGYQGENFTAARELQPTFSTNIVRTPQHYKTRSSSAGPPAQPIYAASTSTRFTPAESQRLTNQLDRHLDQLVVGMDHMSTQSHPPASSSSSSMTGVSSFVEEPASMLSPLVLPTSTHKHSNRALGRHSSVPVVGSSSSLSVIPEGSADPSSRRSPHRRSQHTSPAASGPTPTMITPPRQNPLPAPPQELGRHPSITLPVQRTPPPSYRIALRRGLWNRRGDHLTVDGYVVYAPVDRAYPEELRDYPGETVGYRDHTGGEVGYLDSRPELPESLPRFGQPPRQPYEKFVVYEYLQ